MTARSVAALAGFILLFAGGSEAQQSTRLPDRDKPLTERPVQKFAIGAEDGEDWELLSGVRQVAFDAQDNLYVLDGNNQRVLVFDGSGRFVRQIGKRGGGPGELLAPLAMTVSKEGQVVIADLGRRGYSLFKTDGTFVKNLPFEGESMPGLGGGAGIKPHPNGGIVARTSENLMVRASENTGARIAAMGTSTGERPTMFQWVNLSTGKTTDLFKVVLPPLEQKISESGGAGGQERRFSVVRRQPVFTPAFNFGVLPNGSVAVVHEAPYTINIGRDGKLERTITRAITPRKPTDADKKRMVERMRENMKNGGGAVAVRMTNGSASVTTGVGPDRDIPSVDQLLRENTFLDAIPVIRKLEVDPAGRIWVGRTAADFGDVGPIDLIAQDGRYIGTISAERVPDAVSPGNRAAYIVRNDLGVEQVVVKQLPASWR